MCGVDASGASTAVHEHKMWRARSVRCIVINLLALVVELSGVQRCESRLG